MIKIDKKIVGYAVNQPVEEKEEKREFKREGGGDRAEVIRMHEKLERPEMLIGSTYKVKTPVSDHAMYVTINDERGHRARKAPSVRNFHKFEEPRSLPVDRGADTHYLGGVP
jgi:hypothetical protein